MGGKDTSWVPLFSMLTVQWDDMDHLRRDSSDTRSIDPRSSGPIWRQKSEIPLRSRECTNTVALYQTVCGKKEIYQPF